MKQKLKETFPITKNDLKPMAVALVAAGALQDRDPKRHEKWAVQKMGEIASNAFKVEPLDATQLSQLSETYKQTAYWHGTGRYQRHSGRRVDVLAAILQNKAINPALDPFDPTLGLTKTISLSTPRLYARAYADMHSDNVGELNRFVSAQQAANFYVIRPAFRHIGRQVNEARNHPAGFRTGIKELKAAAHAQQSAMPQTWKEKVTARPVNTMMAFGIGSDIPGNYPILFGVDSSISPVNTSEAIRETREARTADPITLDHITHVEVPQERVEEVSQLFREHELQMPVLAIEDMEQYVARQAIGDVLLSN